MGMIARYATASKGFDCSMRVTRSQATQLWSLGYRWCARYVPLPAAKPSAEDIDDRELDLLLGQGFEVSLVEHPRWPGWTPASHRGAADAASAVNAALSAGFPRDCHIFLDLEGISGTAADATYFAETWAQAIVDAGYRAGVYCGFDNPLSATDLWLLHNVDCYWSDAGHRVVANRGVAISQGVQHVVAGLELDEDILAPDKLGGRPKVAAWETSLVVT